MNNSFEQISQMIQTEQSNPGQSCEEIMVWSWANKQTKKLCVEYVIKEGSENALIYRDGLERLILVKILQQSE